MQCETVEFLRNHACVMRDIQGLFQLMQFVKTEDLKLSNGMKVTDAINASCYSTPGLAYQADYDDRTALHLAAEVANLEAVRILISHEASKKAYIKDRWGKTALDCARLSTAGTAEKRALILEALEAIPAELYEQPSSPRSPTTTGRRGSLPTGARPSTQRSEGSKLEDPLAQSGSFEYTERHFKINVQITTAMAGKEATIVTLERDVDNRGTVLKLVEALHQEGQLESGDADTEGTEALDFAVRLEGIGEDMLPFSICEKYRRNLAHFGVVEHSTLVIEWDEGKWDKRVQKAEEEELVTEILYYAAGSCVLELKRISNAGHKIVVEDYDCRTSLQCAAHLDMFERLMNLYLRWAAFIC